MQEIDTILRSALEESNKVIKSNILDTVHDDLNIFDNVDSMSIINILLETESLLSDKFNRHISIADQDIFDATKSPLKKWSLWVDHVTSICKTC